MNHTYLLYTLYTVKPIFKTLQKSTKYIYIKNVDVVYMYALNTSHTHISKAYLLDVNRFYVYVLARVKRSVHGSNFHCCTAKTRSYEQFINGGKMEMKSK